MYNIIIGIFLIFFSIATYTSGTFSPYWGYDIKLGLLKYPISFIIFFYGIWVIINYKRIELEKKEEYSICPKCEETFNYDELENGKCKYCDNIDTVNIEEYYKNISDNP